MAENSDTNADIITKLVSTTVEPDISAAMTQAIVDPFELIQSKEENDYRILPHTLVFTRSVANQLAEEEEPLLKRSKTESVKYPHVLGGGITDSVPLFVLGVAYDGIANASAAKHWPNERGRLVVQITGTCTLAMFQDDLNDLDVLDRLQVDRVKKFGDSIAGIKDYSIPHIRKFSPENREKMEELLHTIKMMLDENKLNSTISEELLVDFGQKKQSAGYTNIKVDTNDVEVDIKKLKYFQQLVEQECQPFGVLLEKGFESARISLTP